eukprot:TRINITY_DN7433_c0_g3_i10.p1 TRINITY_DN7433_c0_g3~~TRINITY_DN7433_c0_g3_i10.p1  ORF type:complete len:389 (+),score=103.39 TRINITY_DN7433_c0_g3_i10:102-1268(+)
MFLKYISVLVVSNPTVDAEKDSDPSWEDNQSKVAYTISLFQNPNPSDEFGILLKAYEHFKQGGKIRYKYTIVPLIFKSLQLVRTIYASRNEDPDWEKYAKKVLKYSNDLTGVLKEANELDLTYRLYLECALTAGNCGLERFAYGFLTKGALNMYEEDAMSKSQVEFNAIRLLIATVNQLHCFEREQYGVLAKRIAQHSSKLVNTDDQCRAVSMSAHLFKNKIIPDDEGSEFKDNVAMLQCLKKSMSLSASFPDSDFSFPLLVELLDKFLYFFVHHPDVVTEDHVITVLNKVNSESTNLQDKDSPALKHLQHIQSFVKFKQNPKNNARLAIERLEAEHFAASPLPPVDPKDKAKLAERERLKENVRNRFKEQALKEGLEEAKKWEGIKI